MSRNPAVGLAFFVPGVREVLRVNGDAFITDDPELLDRLGVEGKPAVLATVVRVREVFGQCGKAVIRAKLWDGDARHLADALTFGSSFSAMTVAENAGKWPAPSATRSAPWSPRWNTTTRTTSTDPRPDTSDAPGRRGPGRRTYRAVVRG